MGPNSDLRILDVDVNTWGRYACLQILLLVNKAVSVYVDDIGNCILGFTIYNPSENTIVGFTPFEIQLYANVMFLVSGLRDILKTLVRVAQVDIAVSEVFYSELCSVVTIRYILTKKKFVPFLDEEVPNVADEENGLLMVEVEDALL